MNTASQIDQVKEFVFNFVNDIVTTVESYPPVPGPPNRYKRTGDLFKNWRVDPHVTSSEINVRAYNNTAYAVYVHGLRQRTYHAAHGWRKLSNYVEPARITYRDKLRAIYSTIRMSQ